MDRTVCEVGKAGHEDWHNILGVWFGADLSEVVAAYQRRLREAATKQDEARIRRAWQQWLRLR